MNLNELIAEAEWLITNINNPVTFRAWKALPLLVKVIKNQQRQIEVLGDAASSGGFDFSYVNKIAAELEDIK